MTTPVDLGALTRAMSARRLTGGTAVFLTDATLTDPAAVGRVRLALQEMPSPARAGLVIGAHPGETHDPVAWMRHTETLDLQKHLPFRADAELGARVVAVDAAGLETTGVPQGLRVLPRAQAAARETLKTAARLAVDPARTRFERLRDLLIEASRLRDTLGVRRTVDDGTPTPVTAAYQMALGLALVGVPTITGPAERAAVPTVADPELARGARNVLDLDQLTRAVLPTTVTEVLYAFTSGLGAGERADPKALHDALKAVPGSVAMVRGGLPGRGEDRVRWLVSLDHDVFWVNAELDHEPMSRFDPAATDGRTAELRAAGTTVSVRNAAGDPVTLATLAPPAPAPPVAPPVRDPAATALVDGLGLTGSEPVFVFSTAIGDGKPAGQDGTALTPAVLESLVDGLRRQYPAGRVLLIGPEPGANLRDRAPELFALQRDAPTHGLDLTRTAHLDAVLTALNTGRTATVIGMSGGVGEVSDRLGLRTVRLGAGPDFDGTRHAEAAQLQRLDVPIDWPAHLARVRAAVEAGDRGALTAAIDDWTSSAATYRSILDIEAKPVPSATTLDEATLSQEVYQERGHQLRNTDNRINRFRANVADWLLTEILPAGRNLDADAARDWWNRTAAELDLDDILRVFTADVDELVRRAVDLDREYGTAVWSKKVKAEERDVFGARSTPQLQPATPEVEDGEPPLPPSENPMLKSAVDGFLASPQNAVIENKDLVRYALLRRPALWMTLHHLKPHMLEQHPDAEWHYFTTADGEIWIASEVPVNKDLPAAIAARDAARAAGTDQAEHVRRIADLERTSAIGAAQLSALYEGWRGTYPGLTLDDVVEILNTVGHPAIAAAEHTVPGSDMVTPLLRAAQGRTSGELHLISSLGDMVDVNTKSGRFMSLKVRKPKAGDASRWAGNVARRVAAHLDMPVRLGEMKYAGNDKSGPNPLAGGPVRVADLPGGRLSGDGLGGFTIGDDVSLLIRQVTVAGRTVLLLVPETEWQELRGRNWLPPAPEDGAALPVVVVHNQDGFVRVPAVQGNVEGSVLLTPAELTQIAERLGKHQAVISCEIAELPGAFIQGYAAALDGTVLAAPAKLLGGAEDGVGTLIDGTGESAARGLPVLTEGGVPWQLFTAESRDTGGGWDTLNDVTVDGRELGFDGFRSVDDPAAFANGTGVLFGPRTDALRQAKRVVWYAPEHHQLGPDGAPSWFRPFGASDRARLDALTTRMGQAASPARGAGIVDDLVALGVLSDQKGAEVRAEALDKRLRAQNLPAEAMTLVRMRMFDTRASTAASAMLDGVKKAAAAFTALSDEILGSGIVTVGGHDVLRLRLAPGVRTDIDAEGRLDIRVVQAAGPQWDSRVAVGLHPAGDGWELRVRPRASDATIHAQLSGMLAALVSGPGGTDVAEARQLLAGERALRLQRNAASGSIARWSRAKTTRLTLHQRTLDGLMRETKADMRLLADRDGLPAALKTELETAIARPTWRAEKVEPPLPEKPGLALHNARRLTSTPLGVLTTFGAGTAAGRDPSLMGASMAGAAAQPMPQAWSDAANARMSAIDGPPANRLIAPGTEVAGYGLFSAPRFQMSSAQANVTKRSPSGFAQALASMIVAGSVSSRWATGGTALGLTVLANLIQAELDHAFDHPEAVSSKRYAFEHARTWDKMRNDYVESAYFRVRELMNRIGDGPVDAALQTELRTARTQVDSMIQSITAEVNSAVREMTQRRNSPWTGSTLSETYDLVTRGVGDGKPSRLHNALRVGGQHSGAQLPSLVLGFIAASVVDLLTMNIAAAGASGAVYGAGWSGLKRHEFADLVAVASWDALNRLQYIQQASAFLLKEAGAVKPVAIDERPAADPKNSRLLSAMHRIRLRRLAAARAQGRANADAGRPREVSGRLQMAYKHVPSFVTHIGAAGIVGGGLLGLDGGVLGVGIAVGGVAKLATGIGENLLRVSAPLVAQEAGTKVALAETQRMITTRAEMASEITELLTAAAVANRHIVPATGPGWVGLGGTLKAMPGSTGGRIVSGWRGTRRGFTRAGDVRHWNDPPVLWRGPAATGPVTLTHRDRLAVNELLAMARDLDYAHDPAKTARADLTVPAVSGKLVVLLDRLGLREAQDTGGHRWTAVLADLRARHGYRAATNTPLSVLRKTRAPSDPASTAPRADNERLYDDTLRDSHADDVLSTRLWQAANRPALAPLRMGVRPDGWVKAFPADGHRYRIKITEGTVAAGGQALLRLAPDDLGHAVFGRHRDDAHTLVVDPAVLADPDRLSAVLHGATAQIGRQRLDNRHRVRDLLSGTGRTEFPMSDLRARPVAELPGGRVTPDGRGGFRIGDDISLVIRQETVAGRTVLVLVPEVEWQRLQGRNWLPPSGPAGGGLPVVAVHNQGEYVRVPAVQFGVEGSVLLTVAELAQITAGLATDRALITCEITELNPALVQAYSTAIDGTVLAAPGNLLGAAGNRPLLTEGGEVWRLFTPEATGDWDTLNDLTVDGRDLTFDGFRSQDDPTAFAAHRDGRQPGVLFASGTAATPAPRLLGAWAGSLAGQAADVRRFAATAGRQVVAVDLSGPPQTSGPVVAELREVLTGFARMGISPVVVTTEATKASGELFESVRRAFGPVLIQPAMAGWERVWLLQTAGGEGRQMESRLGAEIFEAAGRLRGEPPQDGGGTTLPESVGTWTMFPTWAEARAYHREHLDGLHAPAAAVALSGAVAAEPGNTRLAAFRTALEVARAAGGLPSPGEAGLTPTATSILDVERTPAAGPRDRATAGFVYDYLATIGPRADRFAMDGLLWSLMMSGALTHEQGLSLVRATAVTQTDKANREVFEAAVRLLSLTPAELDGDPMTHPPLREIMDMLGDVTAAYKRGPDEARNPKCVDPIDRTAWIGRLDTLRDSMRTSNPPLAAAIEVATHILTNC
ncbi:hypothetical protein ACIA8K_03800 [Catenuloplanes sp. NPDC051500]|uniref:hypothetical protein n=1 Tax=Catenuloplanes sp. NPDC051500 TaxID=3363959 RepID=UPI00378F83EE